MRVICDFETASACDLKRCGAWVYAEHPTTEVLCFVWKVEGVEDMWGVWAPRLPEYRDLALIAHLAADPTVTFVSHAVFEQAIWHHIMVPIVGMPPLPPSRWEDTQATCAWRALPLALEKVSKVLLLPIQKDMEGNRLTIGLSRPHRKTGALDRSPATIRRVIQYCRTDVVGEEMLLHRIGSLSPAERKVWELDQDINQRGVRIDLQFVNAAQRVVRKASVPLMEEFRDLTGGVNPGQRDKVIAWAKGQGVELDNLRKDYLDELLGENDEDSESLAGDYDENDRNVSVALPGNVRRVLQIRQMLGSASIKKLDRMVACTGSDGRARGLLQYHAAHSGRWGGRLLQPQNFPRGTLKCDPQTAVDAIYTGDPEVVETTLGATAIEAVASSLRHALVPDPGKVFHVGDFAGIEMRVDLALAGQHDKCALLAAGADVYLDMACDIYGVPRGSLTKADTEKRQVGKNTVLGCGFQMGPLKFHARYCKGQPIEFAFEVVESYRTKWAPKVPEMWQAFKEALLLCIGRGRTVKTYGCTFRLAGEYMAIDLPSGWQTLWYYAPAMRTKTWPDGKQTLEPSYKAMKIGQWTTVFLYGGLICENIVQALARGLLVGAMGRLTQAGMPIVLTVHDEAVVEVAADAADEALFVRTMEAAPRWAEDIGIPIAVEAWTGNRYRK